jgi:tetratricopeptide (TPR) repeat protein
MQTAALHRNAVFAFCILTFALRVSMSVVSAGLLLLALLLLSPSVASAQATAECPTADCATGIRAADPAHRRLWIDAASVHALKLDFVGALQRFTRAQAGTFGDEGQDLRASLASMHAAVARWDAAIEQFRAAANRLAPSAEVHVAIATVLLDRHRAEDALRQLDAADRLDGDRVDVHTLQALAYGLTGRSADAARALRTAASIDSANPTVFYALAQHSMRLNRSGDAVDALRGFQRALVKRGTAVNGAAGRSPFERVDLLRQPAGVAPVFPQARYRDGFAALDAGDYADALERFDEALAGEPLLAGEASARQRVTDGAGALRRGEVQPALTLLQAAVAEAPAYAEGHRVLGLVYWIDGQHGRSIEHLRAAIVRAPADERARVMLADVLLEEGRTSEAERELKQSLDAGIRSGQIHYRLAQLYRRQSLLPQAVRELEASAAFEAVVGRDYFYQMLGSIRVDQTEFDAAIAAYARRIDVNPNHGEAHRQLGEIYFLQGRHVEALAEFSAASWLEPSDARAHAATGQVHVRMLNYAEAVSALRRAVSIDPYQREARYALGISLIRLGKVEDGRRELETFQRQQAEAEVSGQREFQLDALRREASRNLNTGAQDSAAALFEKVLAADPKSARSHRDLGLALLRARRPQEAIPHFEAAQRMEETQEGFRYLAEAFTAVGDRAAASRQMDLYRASVEQAKRERIRELAGGG